MLLLKKNIIRYEQIDEITSQLELNKGNNKEYEIEIICNSKLYAKKSDSDYL